MAGSVLFLLLLSSIFCIFSLNPLDLEQEIYCQGGPNRTLCTRNAAKCVEYKKFLLTLPEKNYLIWLHTNIRRNLTKGLVEGLPPAVNLNNISWNENLAKLAQKAADKCRPIKRLGVSMGRVVFETERNPGRNLKEFSDIWVNGLKHLTPEIIAEYKKPKSGSFDYGPAAQMIWWNTSQVGCGRSAFKTEDCLGNKSKSCAGLIRVQLICIYYPVGNKEGSPVYLTVNENDSTCQYDKNNSKCQNMTFRQEENVEKDAEKPIGKESTKNRFRNRMIELWPATAGANSIEANWDVFIFFILLFVVNSNLYKNFSSSIFNRNELFHYSSIIFKCSEAYCRLSQTSFASDLLPESEIL